MGSIGKPELLLLITIGLLLVSAVFYLLTLRRALSVCSPENRAMSPAFIWLLLIPFFNLIWHFFVVVNVSRSLHREFERRNVTDPPRSAQPIGLAMCILAVLAQAPSIAKAAGLGGFACWIVYWVKVRRDSTRVILSHEVPSPT